MVWKPLRSLNVHRPSTLSHFAHLILATVTHKTFLISGVCTLSKLLTSPSLSCPSIALYYSALDRRAFVQIGRVSRTRPATLGITRIGGYMYIDRHSPAALRCSRSPPQVHSSVRSLKRYYHLTLPRSRVTLVPVVLARVFQQGLLVTGHQTRRIACFGFPTSDSGSGVLIYVLR
ncbi:hypothetical protein CC2G_000359 [Coprinopsis cinerea AmutBmut pab1-1]|nr:hypothetical protein CC2G_000359 [Coprinopsis cinerea AmutBmut pab1-1]